jgi:hypothetical protein
MKDKKSNVATAEKSEGNAEEKNTSLTVVPKVEEAVTQNPPEFKTALSLSDRLKAMNQVNQKVENLRKMKEHRDNLESWEASSDGMKERLTISDGSGTEFKFSNGLIIGKVKALLMVEMNSKISEIENEILLAQI